MSDTSHLVALLDNLSSQKVRLEAATTQHEKDFRIFMIAQLQKEVDSEYKFLGMTSSFDLGEINDDDLLDELNS